MTVQPLEQKLAATAAFVAAADRLPTPLYKIAAEWTDVLDQLDERVLTSEQAAEQLSGLADDFKHVALGAAHVIRNHESQADQCRIEAARLIARADRLQKRADWLREYVRTQMHIVGVNKIEGGIFTLAIRKNPISVQVDDESLVPAEFVTSKTVTAVDKRAIKAHSESTGEVIPGTRLVRGESLVLR